MIIKWSPVRSEDSLEVVKKGNVLTLNGEKFDFSFMTPGDELPKAAIDSPHFGGNVYMRDTGLEVTLILPHEYNAPYSKRFPVDSVDVPDGVVPLPGAGEVADE